MRGGAFVHVAQLAAALAAHGHELSSAGSRGVGRPGRRRGRPVRFVRAPSPRVDGAAVAAVMRTVRRFGPDVIHAHSSKAGAVARVARLASPRTPLVYRPHGYAFAGWFPCQPSAGRTLGLERALAPLATRVIAVCAFEGRLAASIGPPGRVRVVRRATGSPRRAGPLRRPPGPGPDLCVLAGLPQQGIETLLDALPASSLRAPGARVLIAGVGPERQALEARARARGGVARRCSGSVTSTGRGGARHRDLLVSPELGGFFPASVLEAAWLCPVVATDVGGTGEAVVGRRDGPARAPRDPRALAAALCRALEDRTVPPCWRAAAARVRERFTVDRMADGVEAVYEISATAAAEGTLAR